MGSDTDYRNQTAAAAAIENQTAATVAIEDQTAAAADRQPEHNFAANSDVAADRPTAQFL